MYMPASPGKKPAVLLVAGKLSDWLAERVAKSGRVVLKVEPRPSFSQESRRPYVGDYLANRGVDVLAARDTELSDAVIPGFLLHWDLDDLTKAMGTRPVLWTDPTNWMGRVVNAGPRFRYRYVLGDITDMSDVQDEEYAREILQ